MAEAEKKKRTVRRKVAYIPCKVREEYLIVERATLGEVSEAVNTLLAGSSYRQPGSDKGYEVVFLGGVIASTGGFAQALIVDHWERQPLPRFRH